MWAHFKVKQITVTSEEGGGESEWDRQEMAQIIKARLGTLQLVKWSILKGNERYRKLILRIAKTLESRRH